MRLLILSVAVMCVMFACHHEPAPQAPEVKPQTVCLDSCDSDYNCYSSVCGTHCNHTGFRGYCGNLRTP